jgi:Ca2+-binding EF-hand superfamily protein
MRASSDSLDDGINDGVTILLQRPITIPFQSVGCTVQIVVRLGGTSAHEFVVRAVSNSSPRVLYSERVVPIDDVFSLLNDESSSSSMIQAATDSGDLISLRALLISMFKEVDDDGNGYLTYDEFEMLMEKVELGIQPRELRYVIQEADENENGVVEFDEFVPLAVDMIQSFRALNRAKIVCSQRDSMFEEEVRAKMNTYDFEHLSGICMEKLHEHDPKQYGVMRITEFKRCLSQVAYAADLSESSIAMIVHKLPSDSFGRLLYNGLIDVMEKVKFIELKNKLVHENASSMQEDLFLACRKAEMSQVALEGDGTGAVGILSESIVANILANCGENLSRLQICVLLVAGKNSYGDVDYIQFVPIAAKAIEYMFEPKALRQRAELIEKTDLGSEELLHAATTDVDLFVEKFRGLFDSCDVDHSGMMGVEEFFLCIKALEMELTDAEIEAYWSSIHQDAHPTDDGVLAGEISFQAAVDFLRENIRGMERKKQNRQLAKTLHTTNNFLNMAEEQIKEKEEELTSKLTKLFALSDEANTGFFTTTEMHHILSSLDLGMTEVELGMIVSEADRMDGDEDGLIEHALFLPKCVELLLTFVAKMATDLKENENAKYALELAEKIISSNTDEIMQIASYIRTRLVVIDEGVKNTESRFSALHDMLRDFHSGLTKSEATAIYDHFLNEARGKGSEMGVETLLAMTSGKVQREERVRSHALQLEDGSAPQASPGEDMEGPISPNTNQASKKRIGGYLTKDQMRRNKKKTLAATVATLQANHKVTLKKDLSEIIELVTSVRRVSIQTNIMKQMNPVSCTKLVLNRLLELREDMIEAGEVEKMSIYLPVKACYEALKSLSELRLSQPQILSIISWAECYDKTGMNLDYQRFAEHAAKVMTQLFDTETLLARSHILDNTKDIEKESMQGMSKEDINEYLRQALGGEDSVSLEKYVEMLQMMPVVKLSRAEAIAAASAHHEMFFEGKLAGETVIELTFDILQHICRERFVQRRIALHIHDGKATTKQIDTLKKVAEKFIDFVNVRPVHQNSAAGGAGGVSAKPASGYTADTAKMRGNLLEITLTNEKRGPEIKKRVDANIVESVAPGYGGASNEDDSDMNGSEIFLLESPVTLKVQPRFAKSEKSSLLLGKEGSTVPRRTLRKSPLKKGESLLIANVHSSIPDTVSGTIKVLAVEQEQTMDRHLNLTVDISRGEYSSL